MQFFNNLIASIFTINGGQFTDVEREWSGNHDSSKATLSRRYAERPTSVRARVHQDVPKHDHPGGDNFHGQITYSNLVGGRINRNMTVVPLSDEADDLEDR